jgi:hypothetical protein
MKWACRRTWQYVRVKASFYSMRAYRKNLCPTWHLEIGIMLYIFTPFSLPGISTRKPQKWPHERSARSRAGHQSTAAAHGVDLLELPTPFDTLYSNNLLNEILFPAAPRVFQHHISVLSNTHIFTLTTNNFKGVFQFSVTHCLCKNNFKNKLKWGPDME